MPLDRSERNVANGRFLHYSFYLIRVEILVSVFGLHSVCVVLSLSVLKKHFPQDGRCLGGGT